jgi:hypothetical protein
MEVRVMNGLENFYAGRFEVISGELWVSDPCYEKEEDPGPKAKVYRLKNVLNGIWVGYAQIDPWEGRVSSLMAKTEEWFTEDSKRFVAVDSGQMGIFDYAKFPKVPGEYHDLESVYRQICEVTLSDRRAGSYNKMGVVSSTGYGDGLYPCYVRRNRKGEVVEVEIRFMEDDDD